MTTAMLILWALVLLAGMVGSFVCSGLETGSYSLNRVRLHLLSHRHQTNASILQRLLRTPERLLGTLLIGNNIANYMTTAALTVMLEQLRWGDWQLILVNALVITPTLFVFCETLPKDLFAAYSDRMMYPMARLLDAMNRLFTWLGALPLLLGMSKLIDRLTHTRGGPSAFHPRAQVFTLVKEGLGHGLISDEQSALVERVLELGALNVEDEMAPWAKVVQLREDEPISRIWQIADQTSFTRIPVVSATGRVVGILNVLDALVYEQEQCPPISQLMKPAMTIRRHVPVRTALKLLQAKRIAMAVITDEHDYPVGIVTIKDLVEPITGELASW